jgi:hypothetical protein
MDVVPQIAVGRDTRALMATIFASSSPTSILTPFVFAGSLMVSCSAFLPLSEMRAGVDTAVVLDLLAYLPFEDADRAVQEPAPKTSQYE